MAGQVRYSFDVFDTLLARSLGDAPTMFLRIGQHIHSLVCEACDASTFAAVRLASEQALFESQGTQPNLVAIYDEVARRLALPSLASGFLEAELEWERRVSRRLPAALGLVQKARRASGDDGIVFVSDTPLPGVFIIELLTAAELFRAGDLVFTSADCRSTKADGGLFRHVHHALGTTTVVNHLGDNLESDVIKAQRAGWQAMLAPNGAFNRYESRLAAASGTTSAGGGAWAGASRLARSAARQRGVAEPLADVAAGVVAPLVGNYVTWVLRRSQQVKLNRLFFVARDGEILLRVAEVLGPLIAPGVDCRYLYGSRQAWRTASLGVGEMPTRWLAKSAERAIPEQLFDEVGLTAARVFELTGASIAAPEQAGRPIGRSGLHQLEKVMADPRLRPSITTYANGQRQAALRYFTDVGMGDASRYGLVDTGWVGRSVAHLSRVLAESALRTPHRVFYIGLLDGASSAAGDGRGSQEAWLFDEERDVGSPPPYGGFSTLIETFCAGTEGRAVRYREGSNSGPVLQPRRNEAMLAWGLRDLQDVVVETVQHYVDSGVDLNAVYDMRDAIKSSVQEFWIDPSPAEAEFWGQAPFEDEQLGLFNVPLAPPVQTSYVLTEARAGRLSLRARYTWAAGTAQRSTAPWRHVLAARRKAAGLPAFRARALQAVTRRWRLRRARRQQSRSR